MEDGPQVVDHLSVSAGYVEVEPVRRLSFERSYERLAVAGRLDDRANCLPLKEGMKLGHATIESLSCSATLQLKVHLGGLLGVVLVVDHGCELAAVEGCVLHLVVTESAGEKQNKTMTQGAHDT